MGEKISGDNLDLIDNPKVIVMGIPRGGVIVATEVSRALKVPLDVVITRKLGVPGHKELAFGALSIDGGTVINEELVRRLGLSDAEIELVKKRELAEARRREEVFRRGKGPLKLKDKIVLIVDDGMATGATAEAAVNYVLSKNPSKVILAAPVVAADTFREINSKFEYLNPKQIQNSKEQISKRPFELIGLDVPEDFGAVGQFYESFPQVSDREVLECLGS